MNTQELHEQIKQGLSRMLDELKSDTEEQEKSKQESENIFADFNCEDK